MPCVGPDGRRLVSANDRGRVVNDDAQINIFMSLDFIRDKAGEMAHAKANRVYMEEYRKTIKAVLMQEAESAGAKASATQEREAYAHIAYQAHLSALQVAIENEEKLRWLMVAAQAKIEVWRSLESSRRIEAKTL
jgi:hypothetical protein